jgi:hypothetical protein
MFDAIAGVVVEFLFGIILWLVALVICLPFILLWAFFKAATHRQRFLYALQDGFSSVSVFFGKRGFW